ncbi:MAG TPA: hypothetical protein VGH10_05800 [Actinomycetota bacterium]|jgi:hypothetical protein
MLEFTDWAKDILARADSAARRFNPDVVIRLARQGGTVQAVLAEGPAEGDTSVELPTMKLYVQAGLEGLVDVEEPHDRLVLRAAGSTPNVRGEH